MKVCKILLAVITVFFLFSVMAVAVEKPEGEIKIEGERPAVFNHDTHVEDLGLKCGVCHHKSKDEPFTDEEVKAQAAEKTLHCAYCHNDRFANEELRELKEVMHQHCKACHQVGIKGVKGPTRCIGCHKKDKDDASPDPAGEQGN